MWWRPKGKKLKNILKNKWKTKNEGKNIMRNKKNLKTFCNIYLLPVWADRVWRAGLPGVSVYQRWLILIMIRWPRWGKSIFFELPPLWNHFGRRWRRGNLCIIWFHMIHLSGNVYEIHPGTTRETKVFCETKNWKMLWLDRNFTLIVRLTIDNWQILTGKGSI